MHQTSLRFSTSTWALLAREAEQEGVSVAQYVRDAALFRLAYELGRRGELEDAQQLLDHQRGGS